MPLWILSSAAALAAPDDLTVGGFVESYYSYDTNDPDVGVTALRGFDARNRTFALSLAALEVGVDGDVARGKVALQAGPTALSYFAAEPVTPAAFGVGATSAAELHVIREAWAGATAPVKGGLSVDGGVFLSPVGYDYIAVKDNHAWSLSNLGVGLPFYFTGVRATQDFGQGTTATVSVVNGWNSIVDGNRQPSVMAYVGHAADSGFALQVLWMGGDEGTGSPRQLFDGWVQVPLGPVLGFAGADTGFEPRDGGLRTWQAAQLGGEWSVTEAWSLTLRGDVFREDGPDGLGGNIFWPTSLLGEGTASLGYRPTKGLLVRLEGRHDRAADPVFHRGTDPLDAPSATQQTTILLGVAGSFAAPLALPVP
jgi:hypothetical protein